jgi:acetyltransferase-like isoleucine patch superfamily enzyme
MSVNTVGKQFNDFCILCDAEKIKIGKGTWIGYHTTLDGSGGLEIGEYCGISSCVSIWTHDGVNFVINDLERKLDKSHLAFAPVKIGNHVMIGANVVILKGVTIGDRVVIGAGSVVTRDLESNALYMGVPAKFVRKLKPGEAYSSREPRYWDLGIC